MAEPQKTTLSYIIGEHPEKKNRIVIAFDDTGIDLNNPEHKHYVNIIGGVVSTQLYAIAQGIDPKNIEHIHQKNVH